MMMIIIVIITYINPIKFTCEINRFKLAIKQNTGSECEWNNSMETIE